jgi:hypothetical protein
MAEVDKEITVKVRAEDDTQKATQSAKARLRELQQQMLDLEAAGQKNTDQFRRMSNEAESLRSAIGDTSAQVKALSSGTQTLDKFTSSLQDVAGGVAVAQDAIAELDEDVNVNIKAEDNTQKATQSAKARLRDLQKQMLDLEAAGQKNTDQFRRMAAEAGSLKDAIGDTSAQVKALASDTRTLDTFTSAIQGIAGGFAVAQGAAALFGEESEDVQKAMMKVQAALALVNGATAVANALNKDSALMVNLNAAAQRAYALAVGTSTGAMKAFRLALIATGIGAAVVAIGLLIANFDKLTAAVKGFLGIKVKENLDGQIQSMERAAEIAKERGATEAEVFVMEFDISRKRLQNAKDEEEMAEARHQHNVLRAQYESYIKKTELEKQDAAAKEADKRQQEREKAVEERRRKQEQEREAAAAKQKEIDGIIADSRQVLLENSLSANERELEQIDASYEERLAKVQGNEEATNLLLAQLRAERTAKIQEQQDAADQAELDAQRAQLDYQIQIEDELYAEREKLRQEDLQRDKAYNEARVQFYNTASGSIVEIMRSLGGKSKAVMLAALALEKGMAIAQVVINLQKELAGINANAALNPANALTAGAAGVTQALSLSTMAKINAGLRIAAIAATSIGQVRSITGGGGGGGGGGTAGTGGGGSAPPTTGGFASGGGVMNPNSQLTNPNEGAGAGQGQGMRAYVVESDVRTVSGRLRRISEFAQLGN